MHATVIRSFVHRRRSSRSTRQTCSGFPAATTSSGGAISRDFTSFGPRGTILFDGASDEGAWIPTAHIGFPGSDGPGAGARSSRGATEASMSAGTARRSGELAASSGPSKDRTSRSCRAKTGFETRIPLGTDNAGWIAVRGLDLRERALDALLPSILADAVCSRA